MCSLFLIYGSFGALEEPSGKSFSLPKKISKIFSVLFIIEIRWETKVFTDRKIQCSPVVIYQGCSKIGCLPHNNDDVTVDEHLCSLPSIFALNFGLLLLLVWWHTPNYLELHIHR